MKLSNSSAVPVYTVSGSSSRSLPEPSQTNRTRKADPEYANRVELLQDFEFEEASQCVRVSEDGEWVMSTGMTFTGCPAIGEPAVIASSQGAPTNHQSRYLQTSNTHALSAEPVAVVGTTHRYSKQDLLNTFIRLLQNRPSAGRPIS